MRIPSDGSFRLVEAALAEAVAEARWERIDLETRKPDRGHRDLMLAQAAELALSPIGRDQLLSLALERSAQDVQPDWPAHLQAELGESAAIAERVFRLDPHKVSETDMLVMALEERHSRRLRPEVGFDQLSQRLEQDAILNETLWDHPKIPASDAVRLAMLCAVPKLRERAEELSTSDPIWWWSSVRRWFATVSKRGSR